MPGVTYRTLKKMFWKHERFNVEDTGGEKKSDKGFIICECEMRMFEILCVHLCETVAKGYPRDTEAFYNTQRQEMGHEQQPHSEQNSVIMYFIKLAFKDLQRTAE